MMGKIIWIIITSIAVVFTACDKAGPETSPDLATPLEGRFNVSYLITGQPKQGPSSSATASFVRLERKTNNTLLVKVRIDDGMVQVNDQYEARITSEDTKEYSLREHNLRNSYKLTATNLNKLGGESVSHIRVYQDGTIRAALGYVNTLGQTISLGVNL